MAKPRAGYRVVWGRELKKARDASKSLLRRRTVFIVV
jgi:hypothetical protein